MPRPLCPIKPVWDTHQKKHGLNIRTISPNSPPRQGPLIAIVQKPQRGWLHHKTEDRSAKATARLEVSGPPAAPTRLTINETSITHVGLTTSPTVCDK